jgi:probable phosphoglycerate mutase
MSARLLILRHGATEWSATGRWAGSTDLPMTPVGEQEAGEAAAFLTAEPVDRLWTSPLKRARRTAEIYLAHFAYPPFAPQVIDDLREADFGPFEGLDPDHGDLEDPKVNAFRRHLAGDQNRKVAGPEPLGLVARRGARVLREAAELGGTTLLIGHGTLTRLALCELFGIDVAHFRRFHLVTGGIIELSGTPDALRLRLG